MAHRHHLGAAGREAAAVIRAAGVFGARRSLSPPRAVGVGKRDRADQELRIGMLRLAHHLLDVARLGDEAAIEHDDVLADLVGGCQVVGDVDQRDAEFVVKLAQAAEDGGAQRGVDHRDRLVGDDHARPDEQGARHHDPLPLPAAQLMRIAAEGFLGPQPDRPQRSLDQSAGLRLGGGEPEIHDRRLEDVIDPVERIVGLERILEDHLDVAAEFPLFGAGQRAKILALVEAPPLARLDRGRAAAGPASSCRCRSRRPPR